jgi:hypothetical protein
VLEGIRHREQQDAHTQRSKVKGQEAKGKKQGKGLAA